MSGRFVVRLDWRPRRLLPGPEPQLAPEGDGGRATGPLGAVTWAGLGVIEGAHGPAACVVVGRPLGLEALGRELGLPAGRPGEILAAAYARWGGALPERLSGRFALVAWRRDRPEALLATDRLGAGGLYVKAAEGTLLAGSELRDVVAALPRRPPVNVAAVACWLADGEVPPGATLYEGVARQRGGRLLELTPSGPAERVYWRPRYAPAPATREEAVSTVRREIERAVSAPLPGQGDAGILLSGGIDSTTVAAFARGTGHAPTAYSLVFPDYPEIDESAAIELVCARLGLASVRLAARPGSVLRAAVEYARDWAVPCPAPSRAVHTPLIDRIAADAVSVLLDGQGGDEVFGGSPFLIADRIRGGRLRAALALARELSGSDERSGRRPVTRELMAYGVRGALPHPAHRLARRLRPHAYGEPLLRPEAQAHRLESLDPWAWKQLDGPRWWAQLADLLTVQRERTGAHDFLRHKDVAARTIGVHPFLDDADLIETVLSLPADLQLDPVHDRPLLRAAASGALPDEIRLSTRKADFAPVVVDALSTADALFLDDLLGPSAELGGLVDLGVVRERLLSRPRERRGGRWLWTVWRLAAAECWLRQERDGSFAEEALTRLTGAGTPPAQTG